MGKRVGITYRNPVKAVPYARALEAIGVEPVLISPDAPRPLDGLDGLLLTGGTDLNPSRYGQQPHPQTEAADDPRDELEARLLREALDRDVPVLAICRGMQLFNVEHGGTLEQHMENHEARTPDPAQPAHAVTVSDGSRLAKILGPGEHPVNSRHHQAIAKVGVGLAVTARSAGDNVIEGLERTDKKFAVAVQWHPEDQVASDRKQRYLFEAFRDAL